MEHRPSPVERGGPAPLPADQELAGCVQIRLRDLSRAVGRQMAVEVREGVVTLRGKVPTFYLRQVFVHNCLRVPGVAGIIDEMSVGE